MSHGLDALAPFQDIVVVVNTQLTAQVEREETARLLDCYSSLRFLDGTRSITTWISDDLSESECLTR
jgi:hypothetical protein